MENYNEYIEESMNGFFNTLNERDKRKYAAIEAIKLGYGGIGYISEILSVDPKTIKSGMEELKKKL
jgi:hypothetical protein